MFTPTGAVWSYLACTNANACVDVNSGADLQPTNRAEHPKNNTLKAFQFTHVSYTPSHAYRLSQIPNDPPFFSYFHALSMELHVTPSTVEQSSGLDFSEFSTFRHCHELKNSQFPVTRSNEQVEKALLV